MSTTAAYAQWWEDLRTAGDRAVSQEARRSRVARMFFGHATPSVSVDQVYGECLASLIEVAREARAKPALKNGFPIRAAWWRRRE